MTTRCERVDANICSLHKTGHILRLQRRRFSSYSVSYSVFAACVFEGAEDESTAAVVLHMVSQVLAGDVGRPTLVRTLDGKPRAVVLVVLQEKECGQTG